MTQVFIYGAGLAGTRLFNDPGNWVAAGSKIECVANGGLGGRGAAGCVNTASGSGGGGAAYAFAANVTPTFPVSFSAPLGGSSANTWWNGSTQSPGNIVAGFGGPGGSNLATGTTTPGAGGTVAYPAGFAGASGGAGVQNNSGAGGGGGAGGMHGAGSPGVAGSGATSGPGGAGDGGNTPGGAINTTAPGTQWDHLHGIGGGGGAGTTSSTNLGVGGNFGGGGGGGWSFSYGGGAGANSLIVVTYQPPRTSTQIFLYNGVVSFPNPGNWNPTSNKVECVGMGGVGAPGLVGSFSASGPGGGGGGYGWAVNLGPTFPVTVNVPKYVPSPGFPAGTCFWNGTASSPGNVSAAFGFGGANANSGGSSLGGGGGSAYPNPSVGGTGGNGVSMDGGQGAGGGGGGAGPHGNGLVGVAGSGNTSGAGGAGDAGNTPAPTSPGQMVTGTQWDNIYGVGSGGYAASGVVGNAGNFGGGGAGGYGYNETSNPSGAGGSPLMVITYVPLVPPAPQGQAQIMA